MIKVCLVGVEVAKEKSLLESQADIALRVITETDIDKVLSILSEEKANILIISDTVGAALANELCQLTYLRSPETKTLIICNEEADYQRLQQTGFSCRGFILYEQRHAIVRAARVVNDGESWLSRRLVTAILDDLATGARAGLSPLKLVRRN